MDAGNPQSLHNVVDLVDEAYFYGYALPQSQREAIARWIAARPLSAVGMPAPTRDDYVRGVTLFTGEKLHTRLAVNHVLGIEAFRVLNLLGAKDLMNAGQMQKVLQAIQQACFTRGCIIGECAHATVAYWRCLAAGALDPPPENLHKLQRGMEELAAQRDGKGRWKRFPFYYTVMALLELPNDLAESELQYVAAACRRRKSGVLERRFEQRRQEIASRALAHAAHVGDRDNPA